MSGLDILIVEDDAAQREMLRDFLIEAGHRVAEARKGTEAVRLLSGGFFDLVLLDFRMHGMSGLDVLQEAKRINPEIDAVMMTAYGTIEMAVEAMKAGAMDYVTKPVDLDRLCISIDRAVQRRTLVRENEVLRQELKSKGVTCEAIHYCSRKMAELVNLAGRIAPSHATVLIEGETGTGKELFARLIHQLSPRAERPLIAVNCAAIPETLIESALFGHEKGAFTGAVQRRIGRFEQADGGTLFLDEIGELSLPVQVKLLRFLQEREFQRVGGERTIKADVRILSATHQDLQARIKEGSFREDLLYRINVVTLKVPPLRERREDIPLLIDHFVKYFSGENRKKIVEVTREARDRLIKYDYPGNVRELENIIERAVVISRGHVLSVHDLPFHEVSLGETDQFEALPHSGSFQQTVATFERQLLQDALQKAGFNQTRAAMSLGLSERMLRYKLKKLGLK